METERKLVIAGLQVLTSNKVPDGVMIVSIAEGERLGQMVVEATANAKIKDLEGGK